MTKAPRRKRRNGRSVLGIVTMMLIGSAVIRLGGDVGQALARVPRAKDFSASQEGAPACKQPQELRGLMTALDKREKRLRAKQVALDERMQALSVAETAVNNKLAELKQAEAKLRGTIATAETASEDDLSRLTKVYEKMKPQQAAALFEKMDPDFAAGFLGRMSPEAAAGIMAGLAPETATAFSVVLAGRNARVPKE